MQENLPDIQMSPVKSSAVESCGFCKETGRIAVTYKGGRTYHMSGATREDFNGLMKADSFGKHLNKIKGNFETSRFEG